MGEKTFVLSDTWFNRPCGNHFGEDHNTYNNILITNWNDTVSEEDTVYVLGGFGICDLYDIVFQLNGNIVFLNSFFSDDERESRDNLAVRIENSINKDLKNKITFSGNQIEVLKDKDVILSYLPLSEWIGKNTGTLCFHGMTTKTNMNEGNVCCNIDSWGMKPVNVDETSSSIKKFKNI